MEKPVKLATTSSSRPQLTLLNDGALDAVCVRSHILPSADLAAFVAVGWSLQWKLADGQAFTQQVLPNPSMQIVVNERGRADVVGIVTGAFSTTLEGEGMFFGLRFRPCGFHALVRKSVATFTNRRLAVSGILPGIDAGRLQRLAANADRSGLMACMEEGLRGLAPQRDETGVRLEELISGMESDSQMTTVDQAARSFGTSSRTLQRLFHEHVGVSPKWILRGSG